MTEPEWVVETEGLTRRFGEFLAVDHVTLQVPRGSIFLSPPSLPEGPVEIRAREAVAG